MKALTGKITRLTLALLTLAACAPAQSSSDSARARFELFAGYSLLHENGHALNGWTGTLTRNVNQWLGLAANVDGHYRSQTVAGSQTTEHQYAFTVGPYLSFHTPTRVTPFAFALFGGARISTSDAGNSASDIGFAANIGGGLDVRVNDRISARVIQVDSAFTRFSGIETTSPRVSAGLVFHFGAD